jgi:hypothetical protein
VLSDADVRSLQIHLLDEPDVGRNWRVVLIQRAWKSIQNKFTFQVDAWSMRSKGLDGSVRLPHPPLTNLAGSGRAQFPDVPCQRIRVISYSGS